MEETVWKEGIRERQVEAARGSQTRGGGMGDLERSNWILLFVLLERLFSYVVMFQLFFFARSEQSRGWMTNKLLILVTWFVFVSHAIY